MWLEQYHRDGYARIPAVFSEKEIATLRDEVAALYGSEIVSSRDNVRCRWQDHSATNECRLDAIDPVIDLSPCAARTARDPRLLAILSVIFGEPAHLFKDKLLFKPAGAPGYDLHQDYIAWDDFPRSFTTAIVALDPATRKNGATEFFAGYHRLGPLTPLDGRFHRLAPESIDPRRGEVVELDPGDVVVFSGFTPHRSAINESNVSRRLLYFSYNAASEGGEQRESHYEQFVVWLKARYAEFGRFDTHFR